MLGISISGSIYFFAILILILLIHLKTRKFGTIFLISFLIQTFFVGILKITVHRTRPNGLPYSFPSGHAGRWFVLTDLFQNKYFIIGSIILGILVSISRIYLHAHYASDVIVGAIIGYLSGYAGKRIYPWLRKWTKENIGLEI